MDYSLESALREEADSWFLRNDASHAETDPVFEILGLIHGSRPISRLLEVGALDGRRLQTAAATFGCQAMGVEASPAAVAAGKLRYPGVTLVCGVAPAVLEDFEGDLHFDVIVLGFFLYLLPRRWLFQLAAVVDRLLQEGGHLVVFDFLGNRESLEYAHDRRLSTFKMDYSSCWTWNPQYSLLNRSVLDHSNFNVPFPEDAGHWVTIDVLRKESIERAYRRVTAKAPKTL